MTTVATLTNISQAFLLRSMLEAEGIGAFLPDETVAQMGDPFVNGIRVQVADGDAEKAAEVVREFWKPPEPGNV